MRLLKRDNGNVNLTKDLTDAEAFKLKYAILSHTWGSEEEEVTLEDVENGETSKPGWRKIQFCIDQSARDGLEYFWVDTCCINKRSGPELTKSLISMYRWYAHADRCYVYLTDTAHLASSRWFTRGWTLQELIAPTILEFFCEGTSLGTKTSLETEICEITLIPIEVLRGRALSEYSVKERMRWQEGRQTKEPEDFVYAMLGLLDVAMPILYGEGLSKAHERLERELLIHQHNISVPPMRTLRSMAAAEEAYLFALHRKEQAPGYHVSTLQTVHDLGTLYLRQGRPARAEAMLQRALDGREDLLGLKHISTLETVLHLGVLYRFQLQITKAEEALSRALQGREEALGVDDASTLDSVYELAWLQLLRGKFAHAEAGFMRVLHAREAVHGPDHVATLSAVHALGASLSAQLKFPEAIGRLQQALSGRERLLGLEHIDTLTSASELGITCVFRGLSSKVLHAASSDKMHKQCSGHDEQSYPDTNATTKLLTRALSGHEKALGPHHFTTLESAERLATMYASHGNDLAKAEDLYLRVQRSNEHTNRFPPEHPRALLPLQKLARVRQSQGLFEEAERLLEQCHKAYSKLDKPCAAFTLTVLLSWAECTTN
ncbi:hypothetical protein AMS68_007741 [Peltaster fructicola]|uniref:Heterokaryon incompatibility domain-containing protein n=1 Tax=Peltaster fructicola TaxID=286661 RepID=A0A6H0Y5D6_9PEZI|nr:hypothetical protein AMS68_007741 [Peltaster fructicola]